MALIAAVSEVMADGRLHFQVISQIILQAYSSVKYLIL
jgi:predicted amino acid-binding ACT domain protein